MGRSGYDMPNFRSSNSDPNATPPRKAGMGLIVPNPSWPQQDPKGKGKERADASSGSAGGTHQTHHAHLPPVRRSADFREAVVEPFPELPQSQRHHRGFGLNVGPRTYIPVGAGGSGGSRARPRALELAGGSANNPIDVDVGSTSSSSSAAGFASSGDGMSDDDLKTPRASQFALPDQPPRTASRSSQHPLQPQHSQAYYQGNRQYDHLPAPRRVLPSQASQFGFTTNNNGSGGGGGNSQSKSQGSQHATNFSAPPSASSRHGAFTSDTSQPPQLYGSMSSGTGAYDFRSSSSSSSGMTNARGMATPNPGQMGFSPGLSPMSTAATTPRAIPGPPPGFPPGFSTRFPPGFNTRFPLGFNTGPLDGAGSRPRLEARGFPFFPPQPPTQAGKDRRRKAALDAGFEELLAKRQKRNH